MLITFLRTIERSLLASIDVLISIVAGFTGGITRGLRSFQDWIRKAI
tara:strand:- start:643 stop:783 length:141 start_codon:yes stop_codon:yes gene_type:complete